MAKCSVQPEVKNRSEIKDSWRETLDMVVVVVVSVLLLKMYVVDAFVIPTGSMASTLLGDYKSVVCEQCGYEYPVNGAQFTQPQDGAVPQPVVTSDCPNCGFCNRAR